MKTYADTSFIVALYLPDSNSQAAVAQLAGKPVSLILTDFTKLEFSNAVAARCFRGDISSEQMDRTLAAFREDFRSGSFHTESIPENCWERATALAETYTRRLGTRALDILHVSLASALGATVFSTFDDRQAQLARAVGLKVLPR